MQTEKKEKRAEDEADAPFVTNPEETEVDRLILRVMNSSDSNPPPPSALPSLLSYTAHHDEGSPSTSDKLLLAHALSAYSSDPGLALSCLLVLSSASPAASMLDALLARSTSRASSAVLVSLGFRYFALLSLAATHPFPLPQELNVVMGDGQLLDVSEDLLHQQVDALARLYEPLGGAPTRPEVLSVALHYAGLRAEAKKAELVLSHIPGVDVDRFTSDAQYRHATIFSLVQTSTAESLLIALSLAARYGLPIAPLYIERLRWLLLSDASLIEVQQEVEQWTTQLRMSPKDTYAALARDIFPRVLGRDLERLHYVIRLADGCFAAHDVITKSSSSSPRKAAAELSARTARQLITTHLQVLDRLIRAHLALDYHRLIDKEQVAAVVYDVVEEENVHLLGRLADRLNELVVAPSPLPSFPTPSVGGAPIVASPQSPSRAPLPPLVTPSLVLRQFLLKSLSASLQSLHFVADAWFERYGRYFVQLTPVDAAALVTQAASIERLPSPVTVQPLMQRLTLVELSLTKLQTSGKGADASNADRAHDPVVELRDHLRVLVRVVQIRSIASSPFLDQLVRKAQWDSVLETIVLDGPAAGVTVKDIRELFSILADHRTSSIAEWGIDAIVRRLCDRCTEVLLRPLPEKWLPETTPLSALCSPPALCALVIADAEQALALGQLHTLLLLYASDAQLSAVVVASPPSLAILLLLHALTTSHPSSLTQARRELLRRDEDARLRSIAEEHSALLQLLLQQTASRERRDRGQSAAPDEKENSAEGRPAAQGVGHGDHSVPSSASRLSCALSAAVLEVDSRTPLSQPIDSQEWYNLALTVRSHAPSPVKACGHGMVASGAHVRCGLLLSPQLTSNDSSALLVDVWQRRLNSVLSEREQSALFAQCSASSDSATRASAVVLGLSSHFSTLREAAAAALLTRVDESSAATEWEATPAIITALCTSDQLPLFVRSKLYPALTAALVRLCGSPPSADAAAAPDMPALVRCAECDAALAIRFPLEKSVDRVAERAFAVSVAALVVRRLYPEAVAVLFAVLHTHSQLRSMELGLELVRAHVADAEKKVGATGEERQLCQKAMQVLNEDQLGLPAPSKREGRR